MSEGSPKVSIVLPVYNGAKYIKQSIDSCLSQTYRNIELVVIDDGSTDETPEIVRSYRDKRIRYFRHKKNEGLPNALNTGFASTEGEYLTWTSADNQYLPTAIEEMTLFLATNKEVDFVYSDYWAHNLETGHKELRRLPDELNFAENNSVGPCFLYTRRVYQAVGGYDPKYKLVEDYDYWIRICKKFNAAHYPKPLYVYGEHSESLKSTKHIGIALFGNILKYKNKYLSISELRKTVEEIFYEDESILLPNTFFHLLRNIVSTSRISLKLCALFLVLLIQNSVTTLALAILTPPLKYIDFYISFKPKSSHLKPATGKKNILCIVPHLVMGGAEQVLLNILRGTDKEKYSYHIITTQPANNVWRSKFKTSFQNIVTPTNKTKDIFYYDKIYYKYFRYIISKLEVNIVLITNSVVGYQFLPQLKSEFKKVKFVDVLHAENYPEVNLESMAPYIDKRVCISNRLKAHLVKRYRKFGLGEKYIERLNVIYNGIDTAEYKADSRIKGRFKTRFSIPENTKLISFVGRLREEKNPLLFVEIAKNIMAKSPDELKFVIAGDGPDFDKVKNKIKNYGLENQVLLTRAIDYVPDLLNDTYILLVVSKTEGIPLVILEAMSMGVPVISTDVGAISEVVENNVNGFLINANNSDAEVVDYFTSKTLGLIMEKMDYHTFSEKAKETIISNFTLEIMGSKYEKVFEELTKS